MKNSSQARITTIGSIIILTALVTGFAQPRTLTAAQGITPHFLVELYSFFMFGRGWTPGGIVQIEIYDRPAGTLIAGPIDVQLGVGLDTFETNVPVQLLPGQYIRLTDLATTTSKDVVPELIFINSVDRASDVVTGIAPPGELVTVRVEENESSFYTLDVTSDPDGDWSADFSGVFDIHSDCAVMASYTDGDGDIIGVNEIIDPLHLQGGYDEDWMEFYYFTPSQLMGYQIRDGSGIVASGELQTDARGLAYINQNDHGIEFQPGYQVTGIDYTRKIADTITLQPISTTAVNYETDYVAGTAPPDIDLKIMVGIEGGGPQSIYHFDVHSDLSGNWSSDLATEFGYDLTLDTWVYAELSDENNNTTFAALDEDHDEAINGKDNARLTFNPDQSDLDGDQVGDVEDPCPNNLENSCNPDRSGAVSINQDGGELITPQGDTRITVLPGSLSRDTSISITDTGQAYPLGYSARNATSAPGELWVIFSNFIGPPDTPVAAPFSISFHWDDQDQDGIIDRLGVNESDIFITLNGAAFTDRCEFYPGCDPDLNQITIHTTTLGNFAVVGEKSHYWLFLPLSSR